MMSRGRSGFLGEGVSGGGVGGCAGADGEAGEGWSLRRDPGRRLGWSLGRGRDKGCGEWAAFGRIID
jgi:hypothetical protein